MFPIIFVIFSIVKANVHHFPVVAEVAYVIIGVLAVIEIIVYVLAILGTLLGFRKVKKG
jgi:hypothetical protein